MKHKPTRENNFIWLLTALGLLMFCNALFLQLDLRGAHILVNISLIVTVVMAVWSTHPAQSKWFRPKVYLGTIIVILLVAEIVSATEALASVPLFVIFVFLVITTFFAWQQVMFTGKITRNTIFGAICIYFLLGLIFGFAYLIVEYFLPGSMSGFSGERWQNNLEVAMYYSMVTLTTLGYGDITPAAPLTRFLAYLEAAVGVFYTTVLVASLIGMRLSGYRPDELK